MENSWDISAQKTQRIIDEASGGVLFIDEAYSLGNQEKRDSFAKECIDTLNQNLSENKRNFICIIAGYSDELDKCFFSVNPGLRRRFPFKYTIKSYNSLELKKIFVKMIHDLKWKIDGKFMHNLIHFFKVNHTKFTNYAGDMETLILSCKFYHSRRVFGKNIKEKRILTESDIRGGLKTFLKNKKYNDNIPPSGMYN